jgi:D-alanine-D-alanine ligase
MANGKKNVLILFGGDSPEHEVAVITGLQVIENIDREKYQPLPVYLDKNNQFFYLPNLQSRGEFLKTKRIKVSLNNFGHGPVLVRNNFFRTKIFVDAACSIGAD